MFEEPTEAIVNTVNCVGVMGKGVALEFKRRWPDNFKAYKRMCDAGNLIPGRVFIFENKNLSEKNYHQFLVNFPTKQHWRNQSQLTYIDSGLDDFVRQVQILGIKSVALPPLGCGNGGLDWSEVRPLIERKLTPLKDVRFVVFTPFKQELLPEQEAVPTGLTEPRAIMMVVFSELEKFFGGHLTMLTAQKLAYFLQVSGVDFGLTFEKRSFGLYSVALHKALKTMESKRYITCYSEDDPSVVVTPATLAASHEFLRKRDKDFEVSKLTDRLSLLIDGYETPYGMELLSSVHFLFTTQGISTQLEMADALEEWSHDKDERFPPDAVGVALQRLKEDGYLSSQP